MSNFAIIRQPIFSSNFHSGASIPDAPEPISDAWYEKHCPRCKYNHEWEEDGRWCGECTCKYGACEFEELEEDV